MNAHEPKRWIVLLSSGIFLLTFSATGFMLCLITLIFLYFIIKNIKTKIIFTFFALPIILISLFFMVYSSPRLLQVFALISHIDISNFLGSWFLIEPSSAARLIMNSSAIYEGSQSFFGVGRFYLSGPGLVHYPWWLSDVFISSKDVVKGGLAQTPFFNMYLYFGFFSVFIYGFLIVLSVQKIRVFKKSTAFLVFTFLFICTFWQAALTYPFYWIVITNLLDNRNMLMLDDKWLRNLNG